MTTATKPKATQLEKLIRQFKKVEREYQLDLHCKCGRKGLNTGTLYEQGLAIRAQVKALGGTV